ncbi:BMP family ABC transporter substrate-binding protein [Paenibacillus albiflavus]|uniref:BMP family ABC transporter substrate-binding protein n=1 Tax=Paenibacillus albiflavus TaxID=2545760 RepID=A0A4V2WPC7_9BACL|nr:BMP family ABC transporter substrate-binding protein [Paenibacillus albiflavus]TCZ78872.1 BMP family ABC transporter substrate-binding protein [Paenibacillus albiflavus]
MKKLIKYSFLLVIVLSLVLSGCGGAKPSPTSEANPSPGASPGGAAGSGKDFKFGMVTDVGGINDKSFNQSAWEALQKLGKDTGANVKYLQSKSDADFVPNLNQFVKGKYNLTWGIGFIIEKALKQVAQQNPDAKLAIVDNVVDLPNVTSVTFAEQEGSFLVGVIAGLMTKTNKIGFVGGMDIPVIKRFEAGFRAGIKAANPQAQLITNYTGTFDKPDLGKSAAATLYNGGADIIFPSAGATGSGVFNEAKDRSKAGKKVWVIGVDKDQSVEFGTDITLTSMIKRVDEAVYKICNDMIAGNFKGGQVTNLGLKDNGVGIADNSNINVPEDVLKKVEEYKAKIISGEIKVPDK